MINIPARSLHLTLTSVVFESHTPVLWTFLPDLTLTSVVFEFTFPVTFVPSKEDLTLTSVVFEFECYVIIYVSDKFNFNKCCI